jgi:hypothetical protein
MVVISVVFRDESFESEFISVFFGIRLEVKKRRDPQLVFICSTTVSKLVIASALGIREMLRVLGVWVVLVLAAYILKQ